MTCAPVSAVPATIAIRILLSQACERAGHRHLAGRGMQHSRGAPYHPMTHKIERWHQTLKNRILLEHYCVPGDLRAQIEAFIEHYNHRRYHEGLGNLTPADVFSGRGRTILLERERIKRQTILQRRLQHQQQAASNETQMRQILP
jgi:putative transposase